MLNREPPNRVKGFRRRSLGKSDLKINGYETSL